MLMKAYSLLSRLGITANYTGFFYTAYAVCLSVTDMENLLVVTKRLYPDVAKRYNTSAANIERNIRTVVDIAWNYNPDLLMALAKRTLYAKPTAAEFLAILTTALLFSIEADDLEEHTIQTVS